MCVDSGSSPSSRPVDGSRSTARLLHSTASAPAPDRGGRRPGGGRHGAVTSASPSGHEPARATFGARGVEEPGLDHRFGSRQQQQAIRQRACDEPRQAGGHALGKLRQRRHNRLQLRDVVLLLVMEDVRAVGVSTPAAWTSSRKDFGLIRQQPQHEAGIAVVVRDRVFDAVDLADVDDRANVILAPANGHMVVRDGSAAGVVQDFEVIFCPATNEIQGDWAVLLHAFLVALPAVEGARRLVDVLRVVGNPEFCGTASIQK